MAQGFGGALAATLLRPETPLLALAALGPIFFMFGFAALARRLRNCASRRARSPRSRCGWPSPRRWPATHVATLSQAIRRELTSMGDGVERALARAAELETRVKSEVSTLERSYSDNERRIRSLIAEMADQREAIVASGARVRDAIANAHGGISGDLDSAGVALSERLTEAGQRIAASLGASSEEIATAMDRTGSATVERIVTEGTQIAVSIAGIGDSLAARLAEPSQRTADDILERVGDVDGRVKAAGDVLLANMDARSEDLIARINASQTSIVDAIGVHGDRVARASRKPPIRPQRVAPMRRRRQPHQRAARGRRRRSGTRDTAADRLAEASLAMSDAIGAHADDVVGRIRASSAEVVEAIRVHGGGVAARLAEAADEARGAVSAHADDVVGRIAASSAEAVDAITGHGDSVARATCRGVRKRMTGAVGAHADEIVGRITPAAPRPSRDPGHGDSVAAQLAESSSAISGALGAHADEIVGRINASSAEAVDAITGHGDSVAQLRKRPADVRRRRTPTMVGRITPAAPRPWTRSGAETRRTARCRAPCPAPSAPTPTIVGITRAATSVDAIRARRRVAGSRACTMSDAVGAHADDVVGRINASSAEAVDAIAGHGESVAARLTETTQRVSSAVGAQADEIVGRIDATSTDAVDAIAGMETGSRPGSPRRRKPCPARSAPMPTRLSAASTPAAPRLSRRSPDTARSRYG